MRDKFPNHRYFRSSFELEFSSHSANILGADGDGGVEGGVGRGWRGGLGMGDGMGLGEGVWSIAGRRGGMLLCRLHFYSEKMFWIVACLLEVSFFTF